MKHFAVVAVTAAFALLVAPGLFAEEQLDRRIRVLAWGGPPSSETNLERYRELADAGFADNFSPLPNTAAMAAALDLAKSTGLRLWLNLPELEKDPEGTAAQFKDHPALAGYYLRDEPSASDFGALARWAGRIRAVDPRHPCYINLFPNYANAGQLGTASYAEHVDRFVATVPVDFVSFDHYPVIGETLRPEWYENLEVVAAAAEKARKPFWAFALAVAHGPYPIATVEQLRLQVFSNLAYGAQGIQYFTYWTIRSTDWNFHEGPIDVNGRRTPVYDRVKTVNAEIRNLSPLFSGARVVRVGHTGTLPRGTHRYEPESPIAAVKTETGGAVVSTMEKGNRRALVVVNRDFRKALPVTIELDGSKVVREMGKDGATKQVVGKESVRELAPGDVLILEWGLRGKERLIA